MTLVEQTSPPKAVPFSSLGSWVKGLSFLSLSFLICMLTGPSSVVSFLHA